MTEIYLHFRCTHYGLYGNAPVHPRLCLVADGSSCRARARPHYSQADALLRPELTTPTRRSAPLVKFLGVGATTALGLPAEEPALHQAAAAAAPALAGKRSARSGGSGSLHVRGSSSGPAHQRTLSSRPSTHQHTRGPSLPEASRMLASAPTWTRQSSGCLGAKIGYCH